MYIAIANAIYSSGVEGGGGGGGKVPLTDATFQQAVNDALAEEPVTGLFDVVPYGMMPDWDVSQVTTMSDAFDSAEFFNGDISAWDVSSVESMDYMFSSANSFNQNIGTWDVGNVTDMYSMFSGATSFNQDISSWDVSLVEYMSGMFEGAEVFNGDISSWDVSNVFDMSYMFSNAIAFNQPLDSWNVSLVEDMSSMFSETLLFNQSLNSWDVSNVTDMSGMFFVSEAFDGDISAWDVSSVESMSQMFSGNTFGDNTIFNKDISAWDVSNVTNMRQMFYKNIAFNQNLSLWGITQVDNFDNLMPDVTLSTPNYDALLIGWDAQGAMSYSGTVDFGSSQYTSGGAAEAARTSLIAKWGGINDGGAATPVVPYTTNLVASYSFDTDFSDYTGNNNLTVTGNVLSGVTGGVVDDCADFEGTSDYTVAADSDDFSFTDGVTDLPFSISFWANFDTFSQDAYFLSKRNGSGLEYQMNFGANRISILLFSQGSTSGYIDSRTVFTPTTGGLTWQHFTFTYDGSGTFVGFKMYIDGVSQTITGSDIGTYVAMSNTTSPINIGSQVWNPTQKEFDGKMDEYHIWKNRELTQAEVTDIYTTELGGTSILPLQIPLQNIISEYKFEDNVLDTVGTNNGAATALTYANGLVGKTGVFNGTTSNVLVYNATNLQNYPISISVLVKTSDAGSGYRVIAMKRNEWNIYMKDNILMFYDWSTTSDKTTGINIGDNSWHSVVQTIDATGVIKIYLDGVLILTDSMTNLGNTLPLTIGSTNTVSQLFNGNIDCLRIWNKELSQVEITLIATEELAGTDINP